MLSELSNIGASVSLSYFRKKFPYHKKGNLYYMLDGHKVKKYKLLSIVAIVCAMTYFFCMPLLFTAVLFKFFVALHTVTTPAGIIYYEPAWITYIIPGTLLGWGLLIWVYEWTVKLFLQADYDEFEDFYNQHQGYDNHKAGVYFCRPFLILALVTLPFFVLSRFDVGDKEFTARRFYEMGSGKHSYADIAQITHYENSEVRNGNIRINKHYIILFKDGQELNTNIYFENANGSQAFIDKVSEKSGVKINHVPVRNWQ